MEGQKKEEWIKNMQLFFYNTRLGNLSGETFFKSLLKKHYKISALFEEVCCYRNKLSSWIIFFLLRNPLHPYLQIMNY